MTGTLPGADVRGFYRALGVELAGWAEREAQVGVSRIRARTRTATATRPAR